MKFNMNTNKVISILIAIFVIAIIAYLLSRFFMNNFLLSNKTPTAIIDNHQFQLLITITTLDKEVGLSKYKSIPLNQGMIFSFGAADYYPFWMKNMTFAIDIIYLKNNKIVSIFQNVKPPGSSSESPPIYRPSQPADTVLEINAGLSKKYNFKNGDQIKYENFSD